MPVQLISEHPDIDSTVEQSCRQTAEHLLKMTDQTGHQFTILLTTDAVVRELNKAYRQIDKPTNVLSFPFEISDEPLQELIDSNELGDVVISCDRAAAESREYNCTRQERLNWLIVHGFLHLLGYDHEISEDDAAVMYRKEQELLAALPIDKNFGAVVKK